MEIDYQPQNPYVGPRPFESKDKEIFFGRERETEEVLTLIMTHRASLVHAQSGAGKTSFINAVLIPLLQKQGFEVLPVARVKGPIPSEIALGDLSNIYIFNTLMSWTDDECEPQQLTHATLPDFLEKRSHVTDESGEATLRVIIFDQFEELFFAYPERWQDAESFFEQIRAALKSDTLLRVVFVIREDFLAQLDPYTTILPDLLRSRFRLEPLTKATALQAIEKPLAHTGRTFAPRVAEMLVEELLKERVVTAGGMVEEIEGQYVEPVQLQVVCRRLWSHLPADVKMIQQTHIEEFGDVNQALEKFYEEAIQVTTQSTGIEEETLRRWFEMTLITPMGTRGTVFRDETTGTTGNISNTAIDVLEDQHIIRAENRAGIRWYELTHDRFINPISAGNNEWFERWRQTHRNPLTDAAREWRRLNYDEGALFGGARLDEAITWARQHAKEMDEPEQKFLDASMNLREQTIRKQAKNARVLRWLAAALVVALFVAIFSTRQVFQQLNITKKEKQEAMALSAHLTAYEAVTKSTDKPQLSLLLAAESVAQSPRDMQRMPIVTDTVISLQQVLTMTAGIPLRTQNQDVVTNTTVVATSADGRWLAAGGQDGRVHLWQFATGKPEVDRSANAQSSSPVHQGPVTAIALSPDNRWLVSGDQDGTIGLLDLQAQDKGFMKIPLGQPSGQVLALAFHPTEPWLAVSTAQRDVQRINLAESTEPKPAKLLVNPDQVVATLAFSPEGQWLATVDISDTLRLWPLTSTATSTVPLSDSLLLSQGKNGLVAFSPDGRWLVAASKRDSVANLFAISQQSQASFVLSGHEKGVQAISFSPDGARLAIGSGEGTVYLWDIGYFNVAVTKLSDIEARIIPPRPHTGNTPVTPTPETSTSPAEVRPIIPNIEPRLLPAHDGPVLALAFKSDQTDQIWLVTTGADHAVKWWLLQDLKTPQHTLYGPDGTIVSVAFGSQPASLLTRSDDGTVWAWDLSAPRAPEDVDHLTQQELQQWLAEACRRAGRSLTPEERARYLGSVQASAYCDSQSGVSLK